MIEMECANMCSCSTNPSSTAPPAEDGRRGPSGKATTPPAASRSTSSAPPAASGAQAARSASGSAASTTPTTDLVRFARALDVPLSDRGARRLRARLGDQGARDRVEGVGALLRLAAGVGAQLTPLEARRRLDAAAGSYDRAARRLLDDVTDLRQAELSRAWSRYERQLYANDALARHAPLLGRGAGGALSWQVETLLRAARDSGLVAANYRDEIARAVADEVKRRFPIRSDVVTVGESGAPASRSAELRREARRDEDGARRRFLERAPELHQQIERLSDSGRLRREVEEVLARLRERLDKKVADGWRPDPARYRAFVIDRAFADARAAA